MKNQVYYVIELWVDKSLVNIWVTSGLILHKVYVQKAMVESWLKEFK